MKEQELMTYKENNFKGINEHKERDLFATSNTNDHWQKFHRRKLLFLAIGKKEVLSHFVGILKMKQKFNDP